MPRMTVAEYEAWLSRCASRCKVDIKDRKAAANIHAHLRERDLHEQILAHCRKFGWYVVHSRMDQRTTTPVGVPDFVIFTGGGEIVLGDGNKWVARPSVYCVEAKVGRNKLTPAQQAAKAWLNKLGHRYCVVRSFAEFLEAVP